MSRKKQQPWRPPHRRNTFRGQLRLVDILVDWLLMVVVWKIQFQHVGSTGGGWPGILTFGVGWGGVGMITFLALAHISILRN